MLGIGAYARDHGARTACVTEKGMEAWLQEGGTDTAATAAATAAIAPGPGKPIALAAAAAIGSDSVVRKLLTAGGAPLGVGSEAPAAAAAGSARNGLTYSLVAYPAKDNYEGRLYPLDWVHKVRVN